MTIYEVVHNYETDGGYGDYVPQSMTVAIFSTKEKADEFVAKYSRPHVYAKPYSDLTCGYLFVRAQLIDVAPEEKDMWWLHNAVLESEDEDNDDEI